MRTIGTQRQVVREVLLGVLALGVVTAVVVGGIKASRHYGLVEDWTGRVDGQSAVMGCAAAAAVAATVCLPALTVLAFLVNRKLGRLMTGKASAAALITVSRTGGVPVMRLAGEEADDAIRADRERRAPEPKAPAGPAPDEVPVGHEHLDDKPEAQPTVNLVASPADPALVRSQRKWDELFAEADAKLQADDDDGRLGTVESVAVGTVGYVHPVHFRTVEDATACLSVLREAGVYPADVLEPGEQETHVKVEKVTPIQGGGLRVLNWPADVRPGGTVKRGQTGDYAWVTNPDVYILGVAAPDQPPKTQAVKPYKSPLTTPVGDTVTVPARAVFRVRNGVWVDGGVFFPEDGDVTVDVRKTGARQVEVVKAPNGWTPDVREALPATTVFAVTADPKIPATVAVPPGRKGEPPLPTIKNAPAGAEGEVPTAWFWRTSAGEVRVTAGTAMFPVSPDTARHNEESIGVVHATVRRTATGVEIVHWPAAKAPPVADKHAAEYLVVENPQAIPADFLAVGEMGVEEVGYVHCTKFVKLGDQVFVRRGGQVHQRDVGNCVHLIRTHTGVQVLAWPAGIALSTVPFRKIPVAEGFTPPEHLTVDNPRACGLHTPVTPNPA